MGALQTNLAAHHLTHLFQELGIPGAGLGNARGEHRGTHGHVTVRCLFAEQHWDAKSGMLYCVTLHHIQHSCRLMGMESCLHRLLRPRVGP